MSDYTEQSFADACYERLKLINPAVEASAIPRIRTLIKPALESLSQKASTDSRYRNLLRREFDPVTVVSGEADLSDLIADDQPLLLDDIAMRSADIRDSSGAKLQILADRASLDNDSPEAFKYGAVEGRTLYTKYVDDGELTVFANYIEKDIADLPTQLIPMAFEEVLLAWK